MPVAAAMVFEFKGPAFAAPVKMPTQLRCAAGHQRAHHLRLLRRRVVFPPIRLPEFPQHRRHFKLGPARFHADKFTILCHFRGLFIAFLVQHTSCAAAREAQQATVVLCMRHHAASEHNLILHQLGWQC